ncbi:MAG: TIGR04255 family protein [Nitrospirae bacterium]|nr:TIGR04255 family protein [Nitrospirota bacterium]MBI3392004.1 TIGR04255 family protein [Nitrospirota bacterium]
MSGYRRYRKPPVVEALCEIYFTGSAWDDTVPGRFYDCVQEDFPDRRQQEIREAHVTLFAGGETAAGVRRLPPRMQFFSKKGDRLVQIGRDLLVINQLRPYPHFEAWEPAIYRALDVYRGLTEPEGFIRLGVRYINKVVIPRPTIRMEEYFTVYPNLPSAMGDAHGPFMVRVELPSQKGGHAVLVTFGSAPVENPEESVHLLDIYDIFQTEKVVALDEIEREVRTAHENVKTAFEGSITERLRSLFEEVNPS